MSKDEDRIAKELKKADKIEPSKGGLGSIRGRISAGKARPVKGTGKAGKGKGK